MSDWAEQAALDAMQRAEPEMGNTAFHRRLYRQIVRALREARAMGPEWRSIKRDPPPKGDPILACNAGFRPFVATWDRLGEEWPADDRYALNPTHWQPLPAPPKES